MFVYGRHATGLPIRNYGKTSTVLSWSWRVSFWTGSLGRFLFNQNSGKWNKNFPEKFPQIPETVEVTKCEPFTRTENSVNSRSKVEWYWKLPDPRELSSLLEIILGKCCSTGHWKLPKIKTGRLEVGFEGCQAMSGQNLWWRLFQRLIVFQQRTKGQNCKIFTRNRRRDLSKRKTKPTFYSGLSASWHSLSHKLEYARAGDLFFRLFLHDTFRATSWNTIVRLELVTFYGFLRDILFEPQTGILRYSTARTSFELVPFSAFSLWYFSSCKLKYCSSTVWLELATYFGFFLKNLFVKVFEKRAGNILF